MLQNQSFFPKKPPKRNSKKKNTISFWWFFWKKTLIMHKYMKTKSLTIGMKYSHRSFKFVNITFAFGLRLGISIASVRYDLKLGYANLIHDNIVALEDSLLFLGENFFNGNIW